VARCVRAYRDHLANLAEQPLLERAYERVDLDRLRGAATDPATLHEIERAVRRARRKTSDRALPRFTESGGANGDRRIVAEPPLITRPDEAQYERLLEGLDNYLHTVSTQWARVLGGYRVVDIAHKVVGVGSVGLRAYIALCEGSSSDDVLFLQLKRPAGRWWPGSCTATRPGTPTRASASSSTRRRCRPSATRCWDGRPSAPASTTSASSAT